MEMENAYTAAVAVETPIDVPVNDNQHGANGEAPNGNTGAIEIALDDNRCVIKAAECDESVERIIRNETGEKEKEKEEEEEEDQKEPQSSEISYQYDTSHDVTLNGVTSNDVTLDAVASSDDTKEVVSSFESHESSPYFSTWNQQKAFCPIADMRGVDSLNYSKTEKHLRCKLAAAYRLADIYGWAPDGVNAKFTALTNKSEVLMTPRGLFQHELTASSFAKVLLEDGKVIDSGLTNLPLDLSELDLHSAIYRNREDIRCIMHLTSPLTVSFSALKCGLLPLCAEAMELGEIIYSEYYEGQEEQLRLIENQQSKVMFLRNNGVIVCGETVEQAFCIAKNVIEAIQVQLNILHLGVNNFYLPSEEKQRVVFETTNRTSSEIVPLKLDRRSEDVAFEGQMRMLDAAGYQTGYLYRFPFTSKRTFRSQSLVEVSPSTKLSPISSEYNSLRFGCNESDRSVTPSSSRHDKLRISKSTVESKGRRFNNKQQFVPMGTDVREYKRKVKEIRKDFQPKGSSGPQSNVLDGMTWTEARLIQEDESSGGVTKVTAASRGIIQRDFQKSAIFYNEFSTANPFGEKKKKKKEEEEIEEYLKEIEKKKPASGVKENEQKTEIQTNISGKEIVEETRKSEATTESFDLAKSNFAVKSNDGNRQEQPTAEAVTQINDHVTESVLPVAAPTSEASVTSAEVLSGSAICEERVRSFHLVEESSGSEVPKKETSVEKHDISAKVTFESKAVEDQNLPLSPSEPISASTSKSSKMKKSVSVNESKKQESEGVEMRGKEKEKEKEKKKKRGLSAIFSKK